MATGDTELYSSLVKWLENCLALGGTLVFNEETVNEGAAMADCLVQLAPDVFTADWRSKIITDTAGNWKLRHTNLKKIYKSLMDYYTNVLHVSLDTFEPPDLKAIAESGSPKDTGRLIQLMLGVAINCEQKETYIQAIMSLQQEVQHNVMGAIQELMSYQTPNMVTGEDYTELETEHKQAMEELQSLRVEKETQLQRNHELQTELKMIRGEKEELEVEITSLRGKLKDAEVSAGVSGEARAVALQRQLDSMRTENLHLDSERDELKLKVSELEAQVGELYQRNRDLQLENDEIPILRDSIEEMKYLESKVKNYETVISQYKKKLEDAQELRKQVKATEEKNMMYVQQNLDLEEELRRLSNVRTQLDSQKQRIQDLENELAKEKLRCLEATEEAEDKSQVVATLTSELIQVKKERDSLSMQVPGTPLAGEFAMFSDGSRSTPSFDQPDLGGMSGGLDLQEVLTPEMKEKMVKLEKENEILKRRLDSRGDDTESPLGPADAGGGGLPQTVSDQGATIERQERENSELKGKLEVLVKKAKEQKTQILTLEESRKNKDAEIEKYKKYLNKAKKIIENFGGNKGQGDDNVEVQTLRNSLKEKDKAYERLEREYNQDRMAWEREEKLVVSAWYEMGLMMHRKYSQERLVNHHGSSFLAQQRSALYKRPVSINTSMTSHSSTND